MLVKLIQDKAHAIHEAVHVRRGTLVIRCALMRCKCFLECFEISHPLDSKCMRLNIGLVEDDNERELGLVKDAEEYQPRSRQGKRV
jgi:hypothetical protein